MTRATLLLDGLPVPDPISPGVAIMCARVVLDGSCNYLAAVSVQIACVADRLPCYAAEIAEGWAHQTQAAQPARRKPQ